METSRRAAWPGQLVILGLLVAVAGDVSGDTTDDGPRGCGSSVQPPRGSVQIVHPAPGAWLPMATQRSGPEGAHGPESADGRACDSVLLEFAVADSPLVSWLPLGLLPIAPALLPAGARPTPWALRGHVLADVQVDGETWGTVDLRSIILAGAGAGETQPRSGNDTDARRRGETVTGVKREEEARHLSSLRQQRDELLAFWRSKVRPFACGTQSFPAGNCKHEHASSVPVRLVASLSQLFKCCSEY